MKDSKFKKTLVICCGSKGGVGKSLLAGSLCDALIASSADVTLIDCDPANPDAVLWSGQPPAPKNSARYLKVPIKDQWDDLLDEVTLNDASICIVNMGAGDAPLFVTESSIFSRVAKEEGWRVIIGYMLSPSFGSIRPLIQVAQAVRGWSELVVLQNHYFPDDHWVLWKEVTPIEGGDPVRTQVLNMGALELPFPLLPGRTLLKAHRKGWNSLREAEKNLHGAYRERVVDFRSAIGEIVAQLKL